MWTENKSSVWYEEKRREKGHKNGDSKANRYVLMQTIANYEWKEL